MPASAMSECQPIHIRVCSPFFPPSGGAINGNDYHRQRWAAAAGDQSPLGLPVARLADVSWMRGSAVGEAFGRGVGVAAGVRLGVGRRGLERSRATAPGPVAARSGGKADVEDSPLAGKSTLNRLELSDGTWIGRRRSTFWKAGIDELLVQVSGYRTPPPWRESSWTWMRPTFRRTVSRRGDSSTAITTAIATCRCISSVETRFCVRVCGSPTATPRRAVCRRSHTFLTSQGGTPGKDDYTYVSAGLTGDGSLGVCYYPGESGGRFQLTFNMSKMGGGTGNSRARWGTTPQTGPTGPSEG